MKVFVGVTVGVKVGGLVGVVVGVFDGATVGVRVAVNNKKGPGLLALYNEGVNQMGLALVLLDSGNSDSLTLGTMSQANGTFTALTTVSLGGNIADNVWYRLTMNVVVSGGTVTVMGTVFRHATPTDPNSAVTTQVGGTLNFFGALGSDTLAGVTSPGEVGMAATANGTPVDSARGSCQKRTSLCGHPCPLTRDRYDR